jgi:hypothetical protein
MCGCCLSTCVSVCLSISGVCVCVCVCVCVYTYVRMRMPDSGSRAPTSWESLQVSWELGCFCLWFDPGKAGAKPEKLPRKHLCILFPQARGGDWPGRRFSCFSCACLGEAVPGVSFIQLVN